MTPPRRKIKKSVLLPAILLIYFLAMAIIFGPELIRAGEITRFAVISAIEIVVILLCHIFYKKRGQ